MPFAADPDRPREARQARVPLAYLARFALEIGGDFGIAPQIDSERYVSRAALIFARTHAAPPCLLHFAHSSSVILIGRAFISSPVLANGFRP